jgi:hypothetical protein
MENSLWKRLRTDRGMMMRCIHTYIHTHTHTHTHIHTYIQGDQKFSVHPTITVKTSGAQRLFDHPVHTYIQIYTHIHTYGVIQEESALLWEMIV